MRVTHDEKQVQAAERLVKLRREKEINDLKLLLSMPEGRRFVNRILSFCKVFHCELVTNAGVYFNEGQRNVGTMLLGEVMEANDEAFITMMREAKKEKELDV